MLYMIFLSSDWLYVVHDISVIRLVITLLIYNGALCLLLLLSQYVNICWQTFQYLFCCVNPVYQILVWEIWLPWVIDMNWTCFKKSSVLKDHCFPCSKGHDLLIQVWLYNKSRLSIYKYYKRLINPDVWEIWLPWVIELVDPAWSNIFDGILTLYNKKATGMKYKNSSIEGALIQMSSIID
jgi:hypothetical protein